MHHQTPPIHYSGCTSGNWFASSGELQNVWDVAIQDCVPTWNYGFFLRKGAGFQSIQIFEQPHMDGFFNGWRDSFAWKLLNRSVRWTHILHKPSRFLLTDHSALPHTPKQETKWASRNRQSCQNKMTRKNSLSWKSTVSSSPKRICAFFLFVKELQFPGSCRGNGLYKFNGQMSNKHSSITVVKENRCDD